MIYLNLIPKPLWYFNNLRYLLKDSEWKKISLSIRQEQNWTCQACGISIKQLKLKKYFHCHEMWEFDDQNYIVSLLSLVTLCSYCHEATHFGFASVNNRQQQAIKQIMKVNKWNYETVNYYLEGCFEQWSYRSQKKWTINFDSFKKYLNDSQIDEIKKNVELKNSKD